MKAIMASPSAFKCFHRYCLMEVGRRPRLCCFASTTTGSHITARSQAVTEAEGRKAKTLKLNMANIGKESRWTKRKKTSWTNYAVLIFPATTFALGCWQWERHKWKTALIEKMKTATKKQPVEFPVDNLSALDKLEFHKVHVRGVFLYDRQWFIKWRGRFDPEADRSGLPGTATNNGLYVVTPMRLEGSDQIIMVNRGWIPPEDVELEREKARQRPVSEMKELTACVRKPEKGTFFQSNDPEKGIWAFKDLEKMGQLCGALPVMVDADFESSEEGGPIGGQTNVLLRNEHFSYMVQWFALTVSVLGMWIFQFL